MSPASAAELQILAGIASFTARLGGGSSTQINVLLGKPSFKKSVTFFTLGNFEPF